MKEINALAIADIHTGHPAAVMPPQYHTKPDADSPQRMHWAEIQKAEWNWYTNTLAKLPPIDICIVNGDAIEGKGERSEGTELVITDRDTQADVAFKTISTVRAKQYKMTHGTPYHCGAGEEFENRIADKLGCEIKDHAWYDINGLIFDVRHSIAGSCSPYADATALKRDAIWNMVHNAHEAEQPLADVFIRSHRHYSMDVQGVTPAQRVFVTPALQGPRTRFGEKKCSGVVTVGMLLFTVKSKKEWSWKTLLMPMKFQAASAEIL